jgi:hypothetical protein
MDGGSDKLWNLSSVGPPRNTSKPIYKLILPTTSLLIFCFRDMTNVSVNKPLLTLKQAEMDDKMEWITCEI